MDRTEKKIIFIFGHQRSGTTLLLKILSENPAAVSLDDFFNDFSKNITSFQRRQFLNNFYHYNSARVLEAIVADLISGIINWQIIIIKVDNSFNDNFNFIKQYFPDAYLVHIVRDPRDVFISWRKTSFGYKSPYYAGASWATAVETIRQNGRQAKQYYELRYEQLLAAPDHTLKDLCSFLQIEYSEALLNFYQSVDKAFPHQKLLQHQLVRDNFNKWHAELSRSELDMIYARAAMVMMEFGYLDKPIVYRIKLHQLVWQNFLMLYSKICYYSDPLIEFTYSRSLKYFIGIPGRLLRVYCPFVYYRLKSRERGK